MSQRGTWESSGGPTMPPHHGQARSSPGRAQAWCGTPWPSTYSLPLSLSSSHPKNTSHFSQTRVIAALLPNFDLFAQPLISAEIWSNCSPVCDSSVHPNRILFSEVFLEYFAAVGDMLSELACLIYA